VLSAVREVYLLSRFIARTARSAANHRTARSNLDKQLEYEQLYIRSFGRLYVATAGVLVPDDDLNREWLQKIGDILEDLRLACCDYAKLASETDEEYRTLSPFLNSLSDVSASIAFDLPLDNPGQAFNTARASAGLLQSVSSRLSTRKSALLVMLIGGGLLRKKRS
jgi:hypothetical protein